MGVKQIPTKVFLKFLKYMGLVFIRKDGWNHHLYDYPDGHPKGKLARMPSVRPKYKDIPITHIHTNLACMSVTKEFFEDWLKKQRK